MASIISVPSKCVNLFSTLLFLGVCFMTSCQTRYFALPELSRVVTCNEHDSIFKYLDHTAYTLNMHQFTYFKNNVAETALVTEHSNLHRKLLFFNEMGIDRPNKFHTIEAWLANKKNIQDKDLYYGQPVAIISAKGKKLLSDSSLYELIHIYYGNIIADSVRINSNWTVRKAFKATKRVTVTGKMNMNLWKKFILLFRFRLTGDHKAKMRIADFKETTRNMNLVAYLKPGICHVNDSDYDCLEIQAILDRNHNQIGAEKAMIFHFQQIYGEALWLVNEKASVK